MSSLARQLILCCDGTNDNLTGRKHDTNVVKLCELLAADPNPQRLVFYDPGVGHAEEAPATGRHRKPQAWRWTVAWHWPLAAASTRTSPTATAS